MQNGTLMVASNHMTSVVLYITAMTSQLRER